MSNHLTRNDISFLASVGDDARKLDDLVNLAGNIDVLTAEHDLSVELPIFDALAEDSDDDPELIDAARAELRGVIGYISRGEHLEESTDE